MRSFIAIAAAIVVALFLAVPAQACDTLGVCAVQQQAYAVQAFAAPVYAAPVLQQQVYAAPLVQRQQVVVQKQFAQKVHVAPVIQRARVIDRVRFAPQRSRVVTRSVQIGH